MFSSLSENYNCKKLWPSVSAYKNSAIRAKISIYWWCSTFVYLSIGWLLVLKVLDVLELSWNFFLSLKMTWNWETRLIVLEIRPFTFFMSWKILKYNSSKTFQSLIECKKWAIKLLDCLSSEEVYWLKCEDWFYHFKVSHKLGVSVLVVHYQHFIYWFLLTWSLCF